MSVNAINRLDSLNYFEEMVFEYIIYRLTEISSWIIDTLVGVMTLQVRVGDKEYQTEWAGITVAGWSRRIQRGAEQGMSCLIITTCFSTKSSIYYYNSKGTQVQFL